MENQSKPILIPTDFTVIAEYAVESAVKFAKVTNTSIILVHIVKKTSEILDATAKVELEADKFSKEYNVKVTGIVREGSIFSTIGETVDEMDAGLVVMGTHGIKGMQKIMGSWSLKVVVTSSVPIIVVQDRPHRSGIERIAFPVDFKKENREKIGWAYYVARLFNAKVNIFRAEPAKDKKIEQGIRTNLVFTEKFLHSKNIPYDITVAKGEDSFAKESLDFAAEIDADLILITTTKGISIADFVLGTSEEHIITNSAHIPVMCVNPRKAQIGSFSATGG
ncbi:MAG: universal stress protein [Bacteroidales bacterium]|jgi:nucleotide-binding universal stress UspA family protein|nr:universal stress protein [Bacteroidales bacterium]